MFAARIRNAALLSGTLHTECGLTVATGRHAFPPRPARGDREERATGGGVPSSPLAADWGTVSLAGRCWRQALTL